MANAPAQRQIFRRRQFLLDRAFQLKYTIVIALIGALIVGFWGYLFYEASKKSAEEVMVSLKVDPELQALSKKVEEKLSVEDERVILSIFGFVLVVILSLGASGVLITHRIAGPVFMISRYIDQIAQGRYPDPRPLRRNDELKAFFIKFNTMLTAIKDREKSDIVTIDKVIEAGRKVLPKLVSDDAAELACALEELKGLQTLKLDMLKSPPPQGESPVA